MDYLEPDVTKRGAAVAVGMAAILTAIWYRKQSREYNFPIGPPGKFLLGNASQVAENFKSIHLLLTQWSKTYGDIFTMNMLGRKQLVVSGCDVIREVTFKSPDLNGKPDFYRLHYILEFEDDITFGNTSPKWSTMKKTAMNAMKTYSDGLKRVEDFSHDILHDLLKQFEGHNGEPFNPRWELCDAITNFMSWLVYGEEMTEKELLDIRRVNLLLAEVKGDRGIGGLLDVAPWLRFIPNKCVRNMDEIRRIVKDLFGKRFEHGKARYDPNDVRCALDVMTKQQPKHKLSDPCVNSVMKDLIFGGNNTTSSALHLFIAAMTNHPEMQDRAQRDIDKVLGDRLPLLSDKSSLPYIEAMGWELVRYMTPIPVASRCAQKDTTLQGYHIPKGTMLWINYWKMHHDETYWDAPYEFRPERFLDDEGKVVPPDHPNRVQIMPFGAGRRVCIGESLARNRLFLFMTAFLQHFTFKPESPEKPPPMDPRELEMGVVLIPKDFNIRAIPRQK